MWAALIVAIIISLAVATCISVVGQMSRRVTAIVAITVFLGAWAIMNFPMTALETILWICAAFIGYPVIHRLKRLS